MNAYAHRGRHRKFLGLAVASAVGGMVLAAPALAQEQKRDISVTKSASVSTVTPDGVVQYDITVKNTGQKKIPFPLLTVTDPSADGEPELVQPPADGWPLKPDDSAVYRVSRTFTLPSSLALCGTTFTNTAFAFVEPPGLLEWPEETLKSKRRATSSARKAANGDNGIGQDKWIVKTATAGVLVQGGACPVPPPPVVPTSVTPASVVALRPAALSIDKTGPTRMLAGGFATFQITVTNTGQTDATNVVLSDLPPRALLWRSVPTGATVSGRNAEWNLGTLGAGQSVTKTVSFRARLSASGRVCNVATVSSAQAGAGVDRACVTVAAARRPATPVTG